MNRDEQLARMLLAERAEGPEPHSVAQGLVRLRHALGANASGLAVAHGPLKLGLVLAAKWSTVSAVAVFAALSAGFGLASSREPATVSPRLDTPRREPVASAAAPSVPSSAAPPPLVVESGQASAAPPAARASSAADAGNFSQELQLIKAAKQSLDAGRDREALAKLSEHARLFTHGAFASERDALSVLIDCRATPARGQAAARRFIQQNPASPLVDRLSRACALGDPPPAAAAFPESTDEK